VAGNCGYGEGLSGSINAGNFLTSFKVYWLASQEGLCSMEYSHRVQQQISLEANKEIYYTATSQVLYKN